MTLYIKLFEIFIFKFILRRKSVNDLKNTSVKQTPNIGRKQRMSFSNYIPCKKKSKDNTFSCLFICGDIT